MTLDLTKVPIDSVLKQALSADQEQCRTGCVLLGSMVSSGRTEAGVYLIGLMHYFAEDLKTLTLIAEQIGNFRHESSANALLGELQRIKSSNSTRRYLDQVLKCLERFPADLVEEGLLELAEDKSFSSKRRRKFLDVLERIQQW